MSTLWSAVSLRVQEQRQHISNTTYTTVTIQLTTIYTG